MTRGARLLRLLALLPVAVAGAGGVEAQTPSRPEVVELRFNGNESFPDGTLRNAILTRQSECRTFALKPFCWLDRDFAKDRAYLNPRVFRDDFVRVHLFYRQRGFREARIDTTFARPDPTSLEITFTIDEGRPIRVSDIEFLGIETVEGQGIEEGLPIRVGDPLNAIVLDIARDTITQRLRNLGYPHADVLRFQDFAFGTYEATIGFDIYTGPRARMGPITVVGNETVEENVIRRMLPFREGTVYSQELIFDAQRNLYNLEIFRHASLTQDLNHVPDSIIPLEVQVNEGDAHRVRTGGGWSTSDCFDLEARWSSRNFRGGARRLGLRARTSNLLTSTLEDSICSGAGSGVFGELNWIVSADFTQPFIGSPRNSFSASVYAERQSLQDVFVRQALGVNLAFTRTIGRSSPLTLWYHPQLARLDAAEIFFCTSFLVCDPRDIDVLQASNRLAPVGLSFARDRTNRALSPTGGYAFTLEAEHASRFTGSNFDYERTIGDISLFHELFPSVVLAGRLRGGWLNPRPFRGLRSLTEESSSIAHPQKRFYAGGANSVRGFAQNQLGPRVLTVGVEELVFPRGDDPAPCTPESVVALQCDAAPLPDGRFLARPTGGGRLVEGSAELRFPLYRLLRGAAFVDFGRVWNGGTSVSVDFAMTPGVGIRYSTPVGPIRFDIAYGPAGGEALPVVTSLLRPWDPTTDSESDRIRGPGGEVLDWVRVADLALLEPRVSLAAHEGFSFRRLQLHFSIGQAF